MDGGLAIGFVVLVLVVFQLILGFLIFLKISQSSSIDLTKRFDKSDSNLRDEFSKNREETNRSSKEARQELSSTLKLSTEQLSTILTNSTKLIDNKTTSIQELLDLGLKGNREELNKSILSFEQKINQRIESLTKETEAALDKSRETVERKLTELQSGNEKKLDEMRNTVDEKLHKTLETRLGESFKLVSERLELVQKGLGEMQSLATDVGSLKNVLSNVKTKGVLGEYQLDAILEQLLAPNQYDRNVKTKSGSQAIVEFAVKMPNKSNPADVVWLPIDSKFPTADYEALQLAYESGDKDAVVKAQSALKAKVLNFAKDIRDKYIDPPNTTDFGIMFLPFEGLYAEILRIPSLFETISKDYRVTITGPTTVSAFLNSLQMGFRSLAVEKRTSEIWNLLGAVRTEFGKFGEVLQKTKNKLDSASREIDQASVRSRAIERKLKDVEELPIAESQKLLADADLLITDDV
mgnify:CR=1 FL=1